MIMTVMCHDIHVNDALNTSEQRPEGLVEDQVLYADDTICITKTVAAMNKLVKAIQDEGEKYGLKLNEDKCEYLPVGKEGIVRFRNRQKV